MNLSIRDYTAVQLTKVLVGQWRDATPKEIVERAISVADELALELAKGDPVEQALRNKEKR